MKHFVIVTSKTCPWCDKAKALLTKEGHTFKEIDVASVKEFLLANNLTTIPQVYLNGSRIGGYEDTAGFLGVDRGN